MYEILWDITIQCDHIIEARRPDIVVVPGGYFGNFWVEMFRWDPGTLNLYQS